MQYILEYKGQYWQEDLCIYGKWEGNWVDSIQEASVYLLDWLPSQVKIPPLVDDGRVFDNVYLSDCKQHYLEWNHPDDPLVMVVPVFLKVFDE